jgi:8-oxo-dGTP pyrophosphatase MutT (NUDIX family)
MSGPDPYPQRRPLGHGRVNAAAAPVEPRDAATLIVWRQGRDGPKVLMGRRSPRAVFVPGFFVFPGGRIDPADRTVAAATLLDPSAVERMGVRGDENLAQALALAAVRETFEETGLMLAASGDIGDAAHAEWAHWKARGLAPALDRLLYFGRAITSPISPVRFHARFFIARAESLQGEIGGSGELSELGFHRVADVLDNLPIVDVTEFMLGRVINYAADPLRFDGKAPCFAYEGETPFVRYE